MFSCPPQPTYYAQSSAQSAEMELDASGYPHRRYDTLRPRAEPQKAEPSQTLNASSHLPTGSQDVTNAPARKDDTQLAISKPLDPCVYEPLKEIPPTYAKVATFALPSKKGKERLAVVYPGKRVREEEPVVETVANHEQPPSTQQTNTNGRCAAGLCSPDSCY